MIGAVWYSPLLFAKPWLKEVGLSKKEMQPNPVVFVISLLQQFVYIFVIHFALLYTPAETFFDGVLIGLFLWLGFHVMPLLNSMLWEQKSFKYYAINAMYYLVLIIVCACLLVIW